MVATALPHNSNNKLLYRQDTLLNSDNPFLSPPREQEEVSGSDALRIETIQPNQIEDSDYMRSNYED